MFINFIHMSYLLNFKLMEFIKTRKDSKDFYQQFQDVKMRSRSSPPMDVDVPKHALVTQNILKGPKQTIEEGKDSQSSNNNESENDGSEGSNGI